MKFLLQLSKSSNYKFIYNTPEQGFSAEDFKTKTDEADKEGFTPDEIAKHNETLNAKFGTVPRSSIKEAIRKSDPDGNELIEDAKDIEKLIPLLQAKLDNPGSKTGTAEDGSETEKESPELIAKRKKASENLKDSVLTYLDPAKLNTELSNEITKLSTDYINDIKDESKLDDISKQIEARDPALIKKIGDEFREKVKDYLPLSMGLVKDQFPGMEHKDLKSVGEAVGKSYADVLAHLKKSEKPIPGITQESVDPKASELIRQKVNEELAKLKGKSAEEVVTALGKATESIAESVKSDPIITSIAEAKSEAFNSKGLTNEALGHSIISTGEDDADKSLGLSDGSIKTASEVQADFKSGKEEVIKFEGAENLKTIGAGDLYPAEVRAISIDGKEATREGLAGGFFYEDGSYAKILDGNKVKITKMEDEGSDDMKKLYEESRANTDKFKFEYKGEDKDIEIAPGQKFKQSELVAQMAERYGLDPHLLMSQASEITSSGNDYLKDLNMTARSTQRTLKSSGIDEKDWYQEKDGRRFMNPKVLRKFVGGNEEAIDSYVSNSGAKYEDSELKDLKEKYPGLDGREPGQKLSSAEVRQMLGGAFSIKGGAVLEGYTAHATRGLLAFHEYVKSANPGKSAKGVITDLTDQNIHTKRGAHRHDNGYKADIRSTDAYGQMIAKATGMHRPQKGTKTINLGEAGSVVVRRHGPADHFDLQFKPA